MDLSLRHLPDTTQDISDSSFQLPSASNVSSSLLLAEKGPDFFRDVDESFTAPPITRRNIDFTQVDLTPRSRKSKPKFGIFSATPGPAAPSSLRQQTKGMRSTMEDTFSPFKHNDVSFQIPKSDIDTTNLLDPGDDFFAQVPDISFSLDPSRLGSGEMIPARTRSPVKVPNSSGSGVRGGSTHIERPPVPLFHESLPEPCKNDGLPVRPHASLRTTSITTSFLCADTVESVRQQIGQNKDNVSMDSVEGGLTFAPAESSTAANMAVDPPVDLLRSKATIASNSHKAKRKSAVISGGIIKCPKPKLTSRISRDPASNDRGSKPVYRRRTDIGSRNMSDLTSGTAALSPAIPDNNAVLAAVLAPTVQNETIEHAESSDDIECTSKNITSQGHISPDVPEVDMRECERAIQASQTPEPPVSMSNVPDPNRTYTSKKSLALLQISPSDSNATTDKAPISVNRGHDNLSVPSPHFQDMKDEPQEPSSMAHATAQPSPIRRASKRAASPGLDDNSRPLEPRKKLRLSSPVIPSGQASVNGGGQRADKDRTGTVQTSLAGPGSSSSRGVLRPSEPGPSVRSSAKAKENRRRDFSKFESTRSTNSRTLGTKANPSVDKKRTIRPRQLTKASTLDSNSASAKRLEVPTTAITKQHEESNPKARHVSNNARQATSMAIAKSVEPDGCHGHMNKTGRTHDHDKQAASHAPARALTKPIEFKFYSDARIEARKGDLAAGSGAGQQPALPPLPIPDFKAMHEAESRRLAARKDHIVPKLPGQFEFSTAVRAQEREKYDESRRAREREAEMIMEEKRRLQALQEEEEIKELRRRAIPRANPVPEWYANAPKRSHDVNG